ncbi:hypothetical protein K493DRAFT_391775 [Basidiobolus meristosporus CBS 931.73]|uniref:Uncharacterized protein n=1 Tax=Basidiobolus meristosporus CBS 931.73 TaxID=1314790 RepID=A0A1Y1WY88_9FUNG|nr:hypothetical protein K493DRAFT_391775 [Basidiobolus meristosporus CBS 931.73]|eukprot:ORX78345.1 hypothetical protein K493DRAFT_391775 [Basidiobolus meristosporus CBS 931.73]
MLPDSAYFQEIARTQPPINPSLHIHPYTHPARKELLNNLSTSSALPFPSPPDHDVAHRISYQGHGSSAPLSPPRRSAFAPFKSPNSPHDIREHQPIRNNQSSIHVHGLLTPTGSHNQYRAPPNFSNEQYSAPHSPITDRPSPHKAFSPPVFDPRLTRPGVPSAKPGGESHCPLPWGRWNFVGRFTSSSPSENGLQPSV